MKALSIGGRGWAQTVALAACLIVITLGFVRPSLGRRVFFGKSPLARIERMHDSRVSLDVTDANPEQFICETARIPDLARELALSKPLFFSVAPLTVAAVTPPPPKPPERRKLPSSRQSDSDPFA